MSQVVTTEPTPVKEKKERVRYNRALLDEVLKRNGTTLVGEFEKPKHFYCIISKYYEFRRIFRK